MIVDFDWKAGLVFGIDTDFVSMFDEGEQVDFDKAQNTSINIYLGIVVIYLIF
jgi:hypothetical protein